MFRSLQKGQRSRSITACRRKVLWRRDGSRNEPLLSWLMRTHDVFSYDHALATSEKREKDRERARGTE